MFKNDHFPVFSTGASQAELDHPKLVDCIKNLVKTCRRIVIVVGKDATVPEAALAIPGVRVHRSTFGEPYLHEVVYRGVEALEGDNVPMVVADPLTQMGQPILRILPFAEERQWGKTWLASAVPIELDETGNSGAQPAEPVRWYCGCLAIWNFALRQIPGNIRFVNPVWNGWLGTWAAQHVSNGLHHDVTHLQAIAIIPRETPIPPEASEMALTLNPSDTRYDWL